MNYLNPDELLQEYRRAIELDKITPELAKMFLAICEGFARTPRYASYTPKDQLYSFACERFCIVWKRIKQVESGRSIFAWLTTLISRSYLHTVMEESKYRERFISMGLSPDEAVSEMDKNSQFIRNNGGMSD